MILSLKALRNKQDIQDFFCSIDDLESAFEVLSIVVLQGDTILEAHIIDQAERIDLPISPFDGQPFRTPIRRLEKQWKKILTKPVGKGSVHNLELSAYTRRLMATNQSRIDHANLCIARLLHLQQSVLLTIIDESIQFKMIKRYQTLIDSYVNNLEKIESYQTKSRRAINRLTK